MKIIMRNNNSGRETVFFNPLSITWEEIRYGYWRFAIMGTEWHFGTLGCRFMWDKLLRNVEGLKDDEIILVMYTGETIEDVKWYIDEKDAGI